MKRAPGRPRVDDDDDSVPVHLTLPARVYDDLYKRGQAAGGVGVPEVIRRELQERRGRKKKNEK